VGKTIVIYAKLTSLSYILKIIKISLCFT